MEYFLVYRCEDGGYLFCPDCVQASVAAAHIYGPLTLLGRIARAELDRLADRVIDRQVNEHLYAHIPLEQVEPMHLNLDIAPVTITSLTSQLISGD